MPVNTLATGRDAQAPPLPSALNSTCGGWGFFIFQAYGWPGGEEVGSEVLQQRFPGLETRTMD